MALDSLKEYFTAPAPPNIISAGKHYDQNKFLR